MQFKILFARMLLQLIRNKTMLITQFVHHLFSGILIGLIYLGTGEDATQTFAIFKYCVCLNVFYMYTYTMVPVLIGEYVFKCLLSLLYVRHTCFSSVRAKIIT